MNTKIPGSVSDMLDIANSVEDMINPKTSTSAPSTQTIDPETSAQLNQKLDSYLEPYPTDQPNEQKTVTAGPASGPLSTNATVDSINADMDKFKTRMNDLLTTKMSEEDKQAANDELASLLKSIKKEIKHADVPNDQGYALYDNYISMLKGYQDTLDDPTQGQNVGEDLRNDMRKTIEQWDDAKESLATFEASPYEAVENPSDPLKTR